MLLLASYNLFLYTSFVLEPIVRYKLGYSFVMCVFLVLVINVGKLVLDILKKYLLDIKIEIN